MAVNFQKEYSNIANELTRLVQDELRNQGLVDTGALLNSVKFVANPSPEGYKIEMEALDYFTYLDDRYGILDNVFNSSGYEEINNQIAELYSLYIIEQI